MNWTYIDETIKNKKYLSIFFIIVLLIFISMLQMKNIASPLMEIGIFILTVLIGIFLINYYTLHKKELYKVAFLMIILLGIFIVLLNPIAISPDEDEHFARAVSTSLGDFFPTYIENRGFESIQLTLDVANSRGFNPIDSPVAETPSNFTPTYFHSLFQQNPFYGYLAQAIGILIAELFSLSALYPFLFARFANLLLYATLVAIAIRKTPILKIPMLAIACMPMAIFLAGSASIDVLINGLSFIIIAYFLSFWKSGIKSVGKRELLIFSILVILIGLCKVTCFAFIFLLFIIPHKNFKENCLKYIFLSLFVAVAIALLWSLAYAMPNLNHSYRLGYFITNNVSAIGQVNYMLNHNADSFLLFCNLPNLISTSFDDFFAMAVPPWNYTSELIKFTYPLFFGALILLYPIKDKLSLKLRTGVLIVAGMFIVGTFIIQLLTWTPVGYIGSIQGIQLRYFIPVFLLFPLIFNFSEYVESNEKIDKVIFVLIVIFAISGILSLIRFY